MKTSYNVVLVGKNPQQREFYANTIRNAGHTPIVFEDSVKAENFLSNSERGFENYKITGAILHNRNVNDNGETLLETRNALDHLIPFYFSGKKPKAEDVDYLSSRFLDGYIPPQASAENVSGFFNNLFAERIETKKPVLFLKAGGSLDDYLEEVKSEPVQQIFEYLSSIQEEGKYQVIIQTGGGKFGDSAKKLYRELKDKCKDINEGFAHKMLEAYEYNLKKYRDIIGKEESVFITSGQFSGREPIDISHTKNIFKSWEQLDVSTIFDYNKVLIIATSPRHLMINHPEIVNENDVSYPNLSLTESDALTALNAQYFGANELRFIKRTDGIYSFDPYKGYEQGYNNWIETQRENTFYNKISLKEMINYQANDGTYISRMGCWDGQEDHLIEQRALMLLDKNPFFRAMYVGHVNPSEMYDNEGKHVVTRKQTHYDEDRLRQNEMEKLKRGETPGIIKKD